MITQAQIDAINKLAIVHERFQKHVPATEGSITNCCASCGMPLVHGKIVANNSVTSFDGAIGDIVNTHGNKAQQYVAAWLQGYVPDAQMRWAVACMIRRADLFTIDDIIEIVSLLGRWAMYNAVWELTHCNARHYHGKALELRPTIIQNSVETEDWKLIMLVAQALDKEPRDDTRAALQGTPMEKAYAKWEATHNARRPK